MTRVYDELELAYLREVFASHRLGWRQGGLVSRFEAAFAAFVGSRFAFARGSGTLALAQALALGGVGPGSEVICDPLVHFGGLAALYCQALPRFADVRADTFNLDPAAVRACLTPRTRALVVTNLWGLCAELDELRRLCDEHGLFLVEDCAHALDSFWRGQHAGTYGDCGVFSFQHHKQLSTGEGGMLVTSSAALAERLAGQESSVCEVPSALNFNLRLNEPTAAVGLGQLQRLRGYLAEYARSYALLDEAIAACPWLRARHVPPEAQPSAYTWACVWEGDRLGLDFNRFRRTCQRLHLPLWFGVNGCEVPAYRHSLFQPAPAQQQAAPLAAAPAPVAEALLPRLLTVDLVEMPPRVVARVATQLQEAIRRTESRQRPAAPRVE